MEFGCVDWKKKRTTWELWRKFYLGQNENYSPGDGISDSSKKLLQRGKGEGSIYVNLVKGGIHVIMYPVVGVTGDGSKVWCWKEQYCVETWNVRFMNQSTLEVVKQEMAIVNIDILGTSELKWTGMGEFNSDDRYIY